MNYFCRCLFYDDYRGVVEVFNEIVCSNDGYCEGFIVS